jgi:hypothetical protein
MVVSSMVGCPNWYLLILAERERKFPMRTDKALGEYPGAGKALSESLGNYIASKLLVKRAARQVVG